MSLALCRTNKKALLWKQLEQDFQVLFRKEIKVPRDPRKLTMVAESPGIWGTSVVRVQQ